MRFARWLASHVLLCSTESPQVVSLNQLQSISQFVLLVAIQILLIIETVNKVYHAMKGFLLIINFASVLKLTALYNFPVEKRKAF